MARHLIPVLLILTTLSQPAAQAAPKAELWEVWLAAAKSEIQQPDHSYWEHFLQRFLITGNNGINLLDYAGALSELVQLEAYIDALQAIPVSELTRPQQRAYWINLYNAATVVTILRHYPVHSIRDIDISPGLFSDGPWGSKFLHIEGLDVSLNDIEHRILRPIWRDNRLHYALNCASIGCPNLQPQPFTTANSEQLLEEAARNYINHPRGVTIADGELKVSSIYKWFQEDFGNSERDVIDHLSRYAAAELLNQLKAFKKIDRYEYDWSLNATDSSVKR